MERTGYWLHKWTDETSSFDPHGRWSGGLDCYERDYSMWIPDRIKPDDTVAVNDYIDRQFELSAEVADGLEVIDAADAQATIAALQARVQELEQWVQDQSTANLETMRHMDEMQSRAMEAESQLTQRTAELERVRGELVEAAHNVNVYQSLYSTSCMDRALLENELRDIRALIAALPKVEGAVVVSNGYVKDSTRCHALFGADEDAALYAALLQHRQGME